MVMLANDHRINSGGNWCDKFMQRKEHTHSPLPKQSDIQGNAQIRLLR